MVDEKVMIEMYIQRRERKIGGGENDDKQPERGRGERDELKNRQVNKTTTPTNRQINSPFSLSLTVVMARHPLSPSASTTRQLARTATPRVPRGFAPGQATV